MKLTFLLSGIVEVLGALLCYFAPQLIFHDGSPYLMKMYGISALTLGMINLLLYVHFCNDKSVRLIYVAMMFFHGALAMITYSTPATLIPYHLGAILTHLGLFIIFFLGYMKDLKPDKSPDT